MLIPRCSDVLPIDADVSTQIAGLPLSCPILSVAMDTVTEIDMAVSMAMNGGMGIIHKNMIPENQAQLVYKAKAMLGTFPTASKLVGAAIGIGKDSLYLSKLALI